MPDFDFDSDPNSESDSLLNRPLNFTVPMWLPLAAVLLLLGLAVGGWWYWRQAQVEQTETAKSIWTDPKIGLVWERPGKERWLGKPVSWKEASNYCQNLKTGGYSWRLPDFYEVISATDKRSHLLKDGILSDRKDLALPLWINNLMFPPSVMAFNVAKGGNSFSQYSPDEKSGMELCVTSRGPVHLVRGER